MTAEESPLHLNDIHSDSSHVSNDNINTPSEKPTTTTTITTTWNGALSYSSLSQPLVELFFKSVRQIDCTDYNAQKMTNEQLKTQTNEQVDDQKNDHTLENLFDKSWLHDPLRTLRFVFYLRDCRHGKGERKLFRALIRHMRANGYIEHIRHNIHHIAQFGSWKDLLCCFVNTELEHEVLTLFADQLASDVAEQHHNHISLCAKYAPSYNDSLDKKHHVVSKLCKLMKISMRSYRKEYLVPLRQRLNIVEVQMCKHQWAEIEYSKIPSIAQQKYKKAFTKHDSLRYAEYLKSVIRGCTKMNTSILMPHQMVKKYLQTSSDQLDPSIEAAWVSFLSDRKQKCESGLNILPLVDVSGSMFDGSDPSPGEVAIALGLLFSELNISSRFHRKFITFESNPQLLSVTGTTLYDQVTYIKNTPWGGSTNVQKAFDLILNMGLMFSVKDQDMPQVLLILSDMQFNQANGGNNTNWEEIDRKYKDAGYTRPLIIFWNLNGRSKDFPIAKGDTPGCILLSGYNDSILYGIMDGSLPTPNDIVHKILDDQRYNSIELAC